MTSWDFIIIGLYFSVIVAVGLACRGQKSLTDYFLGGRNVPWWAAMFSGIATIASAISYLGGPGVAFSTDFTLHQYRLGMPLAMLVICAVMLPFFYYKQRFSIYEYFESRFDLKTRLLASGLFTALKICYVGLAIYAPALVIKQMFGVSAWYCVIFVGVITTIYTVAGGIKAVIWTDSVQLFVLLGGLVVVACLAVNNIDGGLGAVIDTGLANDKFRFFDTSVDLTTRYTVWGGLIGGAFFMLTQYGSDQAELQRFLATKSIGQARISILATMLFTFLIGLGIFFVGSILFAFYSQSPEKGAFDLPSNEVFPKFIVEELPVGVKGLLVASVLSAAMSTISSVLNSVTTVTVSDFYNRFATKEASVTFARVVTAGIGIVGMLLGGFAGALGNVLEVGMKLNSFFGGPLVGLFLLGMLSKRAAATPAFVGMLAGMGVAAGLGMFTAISFLWYAAISACTTYGVGFALSLFQAKPTVTATSQDGSPS